MSTELESALRAALRDRAAEVPGASISRLTQFDYRPRTRGLTPPVAAGALSVAAAAGAAALIVSLSAGASNAFAGWTSTPTAPAPGQLAAAYADCQNHSPIAGLPLKVADTRGPFTFSIYADSRSSATCIKGPSFTSVSGSMSSAPVSVPAGRIGLSSARQTDRGGQAYSFAQGRTGAGVTAVTLVLDDGSRVQATVQSGWFVAWWPGAHQVKAADVATSSGTTTQTFDLSHGKNPCGGQPGSGCASSASSVGAAGEKGSGGVSGYMISGSVAHARPAPGASACRPADATRGCPAK